MYDKPLISVILATYNGKDPWLKKAIDSVYDQTYQNFEFIIINDCSTNNIEKTIKEYMGEHNNIIYIKNKENLGLTKSLNIGIENSHGKYIARIDDDDYRISKDKLGKQIEFMEKNPEYGVCGAGKIVRIDENDKILFIELKNRLSNEQIKNNILIHNQFAHSGILIKKKVLDTLGYYDPSLSTSQDYELWCRIGTKYKLINFENISIAYRLHPSAISIKKFNTQKKNSFKIFWKYHKEYPNFLKALILRCGAYPLPYKIRNFVWQKINRILLDVNFVISKETNA